MNRIIFFHRKSLKKNKSVDQVVKYLCTHVLEDYRVHVFHYYSLSHFIFSKLKIEILYYKIIKIFIKPDLLLFMDESASNNVAINSKKVFEVPTVNFSHALVGWVPFYKNINFDYYLVYGSKCIESARMYNLNTYATSLKPIGPFFCAVRALATERKLKDILKITSTGLNEEGFEQYEQRLCITSQWWSAKDSKKLKLIYEQLAKLAEKRKKILFLVKPHPLESDDLSPLNRASHLPNLKILSKESSIMDLSSFTDLNITVFSNSAIDFALFGIPTVFYDDFEGTAVKYRLVPDEYPLIARNNEDLELIIDKKLYGRTNADSLLNHNTDGYAFDSVCLFRDEIGRIISRPN